MKSFWQDHTWWLAVAVVGTWTALWLWLIAACYIEYKAIHGL